jgi:hypothetical protein
LDYKSHHELWERTLQLVYTRYYSEHKISLNQANILIGHDIYIILNALFSTKNTSPEKVEITKPRTAKELIKMLKDKKNAKYLRHCFDNKIKLNFSENTICVVKKRIAILMIVKKICNLLKLNIVIGTLPPKKFLFKFLTGFKAILLPRKFSIDFFLTLVNKK